MVVNIMFKIELNQNKLSSQTRRREQQRLVDHEAIFNDEFETENQAKFAASKIFSIYGVKCVVVPVDHLQTVE